MPTLDLKVVPTVAPGEAVTSRQWNRLAAAVNGRIQSALGNGAWRIANYFYNACRQPRNSGEGGLTFPAEKEFFTFYTHLDPDKSSATWPATGPGDPEGANVVSLMPSYVHGNPFVPPEYARMEDVVMLPNSTMQERWELRKVQAGAYDPATEDAAAPAFVAAAAHLALGGSAPQVFVPEVTEDGVAKLSLSGSQHVIHGRSYGGYLPLPAVLGDCGDGGDGAYQPTPNLEYRFTGLRPGVPDRVYPGSCPAGTPNHDPSHVQWVTAAYPFAYYVFLWNGTVEVLRMTDYIEGPYSGGASLRRAQGDQLSRLGVGPFLKEFRGTAAEVEAAGYQVDQVAFDFERFFRSQYFLSPNLGTASGSPPSVVVTPHYPKWSWTGAEVHPAGTEGAYAGGGTSHSFAAGYVLGGWYARATGLASEVVVEVVSTHGRILGEIALAPDMDGVGEATRSYEVAESPQPLSFRLKKDMRFTSPSGRLDIECMEQLEYRPQIQDALLMLRLGTTLGDLSTGLEGSGRWTPTPKSVSDDYFATGAIVNRSGSPGPPLTLDSVNHNPVFEAFRGFSRSCLSVVPRDQLLAYAVEGGNSVLYFKRFALGSENQEVDSFHGMAPPIAAVASGHLEPGVLYMVRGSSGWVKYADVEYAPWTFFTAAESPEYESSGDAKPWPAEGIRPVAPMRGVSNEWVMFPQFKAYHPANTNLFKPENYADWLLFNNPCHFYSAQIRGRQNGDLRWHFGLGMDKLLYAEAPDGYNYAGSSNLARYADDTTRRRFYKACRVYDDERQPTVKSVTVQNLPTGDQVRVEFEGRFHHCGVDEGGFTGDLDKSVAGWDVTTLHAEAHRSMENAIRDYLVYQHAGTHSPVRPGDCGLGSEVYSVFHVYPPVFPDFVFVKLVEKVWEDDNDAMDETDTRITMDGAQRVECYLRALCEGFVDAATSVSYGCATGVMATMDYTWENLMYDANGNRWCSILPLAARPDNMGGYGPLPSTTLYAEQYNDLARAVNRLDKVRLALPFNLEVAVNNYTGVVDAGAALPTGATCNAGSNTDEAAVLPASPPAPSTLVGDPGTWEASLGVASVSGAAIRVDLCGVGDAFVIESNKSTGSYRYLPADPLLYEALPPQVRSLVEGGAAGFLGWLDTSETRYQLEDCAPDDPEFPGVDRTAFSPTGFAGIFHNGAQRRKLTAIQPPTSHSCGMFQSGVLDAGTPPAGDFVMGRVGDRRVSYGSGRALTLTPVTYNNTAWLKLPVTEES